MTVHRLLLFVGFALFVLAAFSAFATFWGASLATVLGLIAAGLACWIAAALP